MLVRVYPTQVAEQWDDIAPSITSALPSYITELNGHANNILERLLSGNMQCWYIVTGGKVLATLTTSVMYDPGGVQSLFIYTVFGFGNIPEEEWKMAYDSLRAFAKKYNCEHIFAYSENPRIIQLVNQLGGNTETRIIKLEV